MGKTASTAGNPRETSGDTSEHKSDETPIGTSDASSGAQPSSWQQIMDPYGVMTSVFNAQTAWMTHPQELSQAMQSFFVDALGFESHLLRIAMGLPSEPLIKPHVDDVRFADPQWDKNAGWDVIKEINLALTHRTQDLLFQTPGLSDLQRRRAAFWARQWLNALAPTNFFFTNPMAMRRALETHGDSLRKGADHFLSDAKASNIRMVDAKAFRLGTDLATTPGRVVLRNHLIELIHYTPTTAQVHETPILIVTPWINKYYVLDLTPDESLVKFLTDQGYSTFIISWKNPAAEMSHTAFDDYLTEGVDSAVQAVRKICKVPQVHLAGYCIGGTLVSTYMAWATRHYSEGAHPVAHWTLLTTLTDFSEPGDIDVFIDEASILALEKKMAQTGFLEGSDMAASFRLLRSNGLIWHYFEHSYLLGEALPAFDVLFWNMDTTRLPAAMHSYYLRQMYLHNNLVKPDVLTIAGEKIDLSRITQSLYVVGCEDDHVVPWRQAYRVREYVHADTPVRCVLTTSGHIFGIVNPVVQPPKRSYRVYEPECSEHSARCLDRAVQHAGSWWPDWLKWLGSRCGPLVNPPNTRSKAYPDLGAAPGTYVHDR